MIFKIIVGGIWLSLVFLLKPLLSKVLFFLKGKVKYVSEAT